MSRPPLSEFSGSAPFLPPTPPNADNLSGQEKPNVITVFLRIDSLIYLHFLFGKSRDCSLSRGSPSRTSPLRTNISTTPTWEIENQSSCTEVKDLLQANRKRFLTRTIRKWLQWCSPNLPARPILWRYVSESRGTSMFTTRSTCSASIPRDVLRTKKTKKYSEGDLTWRTYELLSNFCVNYHKRTKLCIVVLFL